MPTQYWQGATEELLQRFSPAAHCPRIGARGVPILIARAGLDEHGLKRAIGRFVDDALAANAHLTLLNHPTGHHAFDALDDNPRTREIITWTVEFVQNYLTRLM